jgi:hypothetical protein
MLERVTAALSAQRTQNVSLENDENNDSSKEEE